MMIDEAGNPTEPRWLLWAREMQALAQTGLAFTHDQYDRERYQRLRALAAQIMAEHTGTAMPDIEVMFTQQSGYATPKLGVRGAFPRRPDTARSRNGWFGLDSRGCIGAQSHRVYPR